MKYEYTALIEQPRHGLHWNDLVDQGWCEWMKIPYWTRPHLCGPGPSYVYIMRRLKDEPRLWTEKEIQELIYITQWKKRKSEIGNK